MCRRIRHILETAGRGRPGSRLGPRRRAFAEATVRALVQIYGDAQEQLNQNRRSMSRSHSRLLGGLPWTPPGLLENRFPANREKTGKFSDFSRFLRKYVQKP